MEESTVNLLKALGTRLKQARIERNDLQKDFAFRIGVSIPTLYKMEKGDPQVSIGSWAKAFEILGCESDLNNLIVPKRSLSAQFEIQQKNIGRQRVRKKI